MTRRFDDKTVILTGASRGVGAAAARAFLSRGARVVLVARGEEELRRTADESGPADRVLAFPMDVTEASACRALLEAARERFGGVHVLVNNAGFHERGPALEVDPEALGRMVDVNLKAPVLLTRLALPFLVESGGGAIVNVASLAGRAPVPGSAVYSATKFGLRAFTFALAEELRGTGIKVAAVSPGPIDTGFIMSDIDNVSDLTFSQPLSTAEEVAEEIVALCHDGARDRAMPRSSGLLTTFAYLFPSVARALRPALERKGRRTKERLKAERRGDGR